MERYRLKRTVQPTLRPVTAAEMLVHSRVDSSFEESYFEGLIDAARVWVEDSYNVTLLTTTWQLSLDQFPVRHTARNPIDADRIALPRCPVQSVTSIAYVDEDGAAQTVSASLYSLDSASDTEASVGPVYDEEWPDTREQRNAVTVTYVAGYTLAGNVPPNYRHAIKLLAGYWYENRETVLVGSISKELEFTVRALLGVTDMNLI